MPIIDFHAHILPGADHGSRHTATSLAQLELIRQGGTDAVVATPHFYPDQDNPDRFIARRAAAAERLVSRRGSEFPRVYLGAEVAVCPFLDRMEREELQALCVEGTDVMLLEMPTRDWDSTLLATVRAIRKQGFTVVLAHIDRYPFRDVEKLLSDGFLAQINASALFRLFGASRYAELLANEQIVALGSDLHGDAPKGYRAFSRLRQKYPLADAVFARTARLIAGAEPLTGAQCPTQEAGAAILH